MRFWGRFLFPSKLQKAHHKLSHWFPRKRKGKGRKKFRTGSGENFREVSRADGDCGTATPYRSVPFGYVVYIKHI